MPTGANSNSVANQALEIMGGNQPLVSGFAPSFDNSTAGIVLQQIYVPTVQTVARTFGYDFARRIVTLTASGNPAPYPYGVAGEFLYPANGIEVWQLMPSVIVDENNPLPQTWVIGNTLVSGVQTKVIWTSIVAPQATYNNNPSEAVWDSLFLEAVVRLLASKLGMALAGRPDTEASNLQTSGVFAQANQKRNG